jgi:hypothetical protein
MSTASPHGRDASHSPHRAGSHEAIRAPAADRLCAAGLVILATACIDAAGPERLRSTITFDIGAITGASAQLGDGASIADSAHIMVSAGQAVVLNLGQQLDRTDSIARFDIELDAGTYDFRGSVFSNLDTLLYNGFASQAITKDGFLVEIVPQAVNAVLVVSPDTQSLSFNPNGTIAAVQLRNVGTRPMSWDVSCLVIPSGGRCGATPTNPIGGTLPAGAADTAAVALFGSGIWELLFRASGGTVARVDIGSVVIRRVVTP